MYISKKDKIEVRKRANNCCEYCLALKSHSFSPFHIDHIIASSLGGNNDLRNYAFSCPNCNNKKHDKIWGIDPFSNKRTKLYNPRLQNWKEHFQWDSTQTIIIGSTQIGRATINTLDMNREDAVNLRKALILFGVHPPNL